MPLLSTKTLALLTAVFILGNANAQAQSGGGGGRYAPAPRQAAPQQPMHSGSGTTGQPVPRSAALEGYCPVCLVNMQKWVVGRPEFLQDYDGHQYLFPGAKQRDMFRADPAKYAPVLGGNDVVEFSHSGRRLPGNVRLGATYEGRHYFFASDANKQAFSASPTQFANADLALGGKCVVCQVDKSHDVTGKPSIAAVYNGMRFYFPKESVRQTFLANPAHYASHTNQSNADGGSGHQPMMSQPAHQPAGSGSH